MNGGLQNIKFTGYNNITLRVTKGFSFTGNALTASDVGVDRFLGAKFQTSSATGYITEYFTIFCILFCLNNYIIQITSQVVMVRYKKLYTLINLTQTVLHMV